MKTGRGRSPRPEIGGSNLEGKSFLNVKKTGAKGPRGREDSGGPNENDYKTATDRPTRGKLAPFHGGNTGSNPVRVAVADAAHRYGNGSSWLGYL